jgi:hypothetical protein
VVVCWVAGVVVVCWVASVVVVVVVCWVATVVVRSSQIVSTGTVRDNGADVEETV